MNPMSIDKLCDWGECALPTMPWFQVRWVYLCENLLQRKRNAQKIHVYLYSGYNVTYPVTYPVAMPCPSLPSSEGAKVPLTRRVRLKRE